MINTRIKRLDGWLRSRNGKCWAWKLTFGLCTRLAAGRRFGLCPTHSTAKYWSLLTYALITFVLSIVGVHSIVVDSEDKKRLARIDILVKGQTLVDHVRSSEAAFRAEVPMSICYGLQSTASVALASAKFRHATELSELTVALKSAANRMESAPRTVASPDPAIRHDGEASDVIGELKRLADLINPIIPSQAIQAFADAIAEQINLIDQGIEKFNGTTQLDARTSAIDDFQKTCDQARGELLFEIGQMKSAPDGRLQRTALNNVSSKLFKFHGTAHLLVAAIANEQVKQLRKKLIDANAFIDTNDF